MTQTLSTNYGIIRTKFIKKCDDNYYNVRQLNSLRKAINTLSDSYSVIKCDCVITKCDGCCGFVNSKYLYLPHVHLSDICEFCNYCCKCPTAGLELLWKSFEGFRNILFP